jgi:hypothetical protein
LLIAERVDVAADDEYKKRAMRVDARERALGVRRPHAHRGVTRLRAHVVGDDAGEGGLLGRSRRGSSESRPSEENQN